MATLTDPVRAFLGEPRFAVLATIGADGTPQQTVMWYELRGDRVLMNTKRGRVKDRNLRRDARVSLCVEDGYRYVTIAGRCELVTDPETAWNDIERLALRYHGAERAAEMARQFRREARETMMIAVESVTTSGFPK